MTNIAQLVKNARRVSTPLIAINTPDPAATIKAVCDAIENQTKGDPVIAIPKVEWDVVRGMTGRNDSGKEWAASLGEFDPTQNSPLSAMQWAAKLADRSLLFIHLAHRWINEPMIIQAIWNLRDQFKANRRTLILLGKHVDLPAELADDVTVFDEPLPTADELRLIVGKLAQSCDDVEPLPIETFDRSVEALRGLSAFAAEQTTAMSLTAEGLDLDALWDRKRQAIEQTPGLKVFRGGESFDRIGGCAVVKDFLTRIMHGQARPNAIVFVDEIEKMLGGKGDTSGVSQDQLGTLLSYMQDHESAGMIFVGPPGAAKSAIAKAAGNEGGIPTIQLDLGAAKGSLVGQSEQQLRSALKVVTAVSNGRSLWIATCNAIADLPPELRRRFTLGTFFFDLPTKSERDAIWNIWIERYVGEASRLTSPEQPTRDASATPADEGWTGAEIRQCCDIAWRLGCSLKEAAAFIVPVSKSAADRIEALKKQADGKFLSASEPGVYQMTKPAALPDQRRITNGDDE